MKVVGATMARKNIKHIIDEVKHTGEVFVIGRHSHPDAIVIPYPQNYTQKYTDITNINANSASFDFLKDEPELYSTDDAIERYA